MKDLLFETARELVLSNHDEKVFKTCGAKLKRHFVKEGFDMETANRFAIDAMKIVYKTLNNISK